MLLIIIYVVVLVGSGPTLVEAEQSGVLVVGGVGVASPIGGVGRESLGVAEMEDSPRVLHDVVLETELGGDSQKHVESLLEEVVPTTLGEEERARFLASDGRLRHRGFSLCNPRWGVEQGAVAIGGVSETKEKGGEYSPRVNCGSENKDRACPRARMEKVKHMGCIMKANAFSRPLCLAVTKVEDFGEEGAELAVSPFEDCNLVDVRVVYDDYLVSQPVLRSVPIFMSDSAIENCNRIYRLKNEVFEAARIYNLCKEMGFTCSGQEDLVIRSLHSLENRDSCKLRNERG